MKKQRAKKSNPYIEYLTEEQVVDKREKFCKEQLGCAGGWKEALERLNGGEWIGTIAEVELITLSHLIEDSSILPTFEREKIRDKKEEALKKVIKKQINVSGDGI